MDTTTLVGHAYSPGEEVVVSLGQVDAYNVERGCTVDAACLPSWTIGVVLERRALGGEAAYALRIEHDDCSCMCVVSEGAIEGVA